ncbi:719_t:CDS:1 [Dentiscutata erythropus]|uniref:719_t:CDS:1 n=1 Tax=Dentiscutata erythropus TaxID=1348616 RepID=A0A9N9IUA3_9GLOM|nr:719_t:CDS:1 [Dentiscutata erythropus]
MYQDFLELYNKTSKYTSPTNAKHNSKIKEFHDHDHLIVCKESLDYDGCDDIQKIIEEGHYALVTKAKKPLRYSYFDKEWMIFHLVDYFSYQYVISNQIDKDKTNEFIKYNTKRVKLEKFSNSNNWLLDSFCKYESFAKDTK